MMARTYKLTTLVAGLALLAAACTTKKTEPPAPAGPSELGTSIAITATPDTLSQDGMSQSVVVVQARDANGQPLKNLSLRADIAVNGTVTDFGELSAKNLATDSNGRAVFTYTAPNSVDSVDRDTMVTIKITPQSGDAAGDLGRTIQIKLVPVGVVSGGLTRVPDFKVSPTSPNVDEDVTFDASDPTLDNNLVDYAWDFGDDSAGHGRIVPHSYDRAGTFSATLTVTDKSGAKGSRSKTVQVGPGPTPTAAFVMSPTSPTTADNIVFNASTSSVSQPHQIVGYKWQFGDGNGTVTGMIVTHQYTQAGTYNVTMTVTDDAGNKDTASSSITVTVPGP